MPKLDNYRQFAGRHWETGSLANYFAYHGFKAPHTDQPFSEALLLGISGGVAMGYFSFAYEGYDPHVAILTRNTFDPFQTILERLGVTQDLRHTASPDRALTQLLDTLAAGSPAIVWADMYSLPYNALPFDERMWQMYPLVVYGYDATQETVWLADRARVPLTVSPNDLAAARARVKKVKHRLLTLDMPDPDKLSTAVQQGIWDCLKLYTEAPPKGSRSNFGLAAFQRWARLLVKPKQKLSWARVFPPSGQLYAGLTAAFGRIALFGQNGVACDAERSLYADFLDEAAIVLDKPGLRDAAAQFRRSGAAWRALAEALLPDAVPPFKETRELILRKHRRFLDEGGDALKAIHQLNSRLDEIKRTVSADFPLTAQEVVTFQEGLQIHVLHLHDLEAEAVTVLREAMA